MPQHDPIFWNNEIRPLIACVKRNYNWRIPAILPFALPSSNSNFDKNLAIRDMLHQMWLRDPSKRLELATWYVSKWGGIHRNNRHTIAAYVNAADSGGQRTLQGVSTWSMVATLAAPKHYAIYDARVAFSLNALQALRKNQLVAERFPVPNSRNSKVKLAIERLKSPRVTATTGREMYDRYLAILANVEADLQTTEMALFAAADDLAQQVLAQGGGGALA